MFVGAKKRFSKEELHRMLSESVSSPANIYEVGCDKMRSVMSGKTANPSMYMITAIMCVCLERVKRADYLCNMNLIRHFGRV